MSQEFPTPLNGVLGMLSPLQRTDPDPERRSMVAVMRRPGGRLDIATAPGDGTIATLRLNLPSG